MNNAEKQAIMSFAVTTHDQMITAMCLWEMVIDLKYSGWSKVRSQSDFDPHKSSTHKLDLMTPLERAVNDWEVGSVEQRDVISQLTISCELAWHIAQEVYDYQDCFDFAFCPWFIEHCVDHQDFTLRPDWMQQVRSISTIQMHQVAEAEGWYLTDTGIERRDCNPKFDDDYAAWQHVLQKAFAGSPIHKLAVKTVKETSEEEWSKLHAFAAGAKMGDIRKLLS